MEFVNPFDPATGNPGDGSTPWQNGNPATGTDGSIPPVEALEHPMRELTHLIDFAIGDGSEGSGQDEGDLEQVRKSVQALIVAGLTDYLTETDGDARYHLLTSNFATEAFASDAANITTGTLFTLRLPMAFESQSRDGTLTNRVMHPLATFQAIQEYLMGLGPDDLGSRMLCAFNSDTFSAGDTTSGANLNPVSAFASSAITPGTAIGANSLSWIADATPLTGLWEALADSGSSGVKTNLVMWKKVSAV